MDYAPSEQQQAFREAAERFARHKLAPHYQARARQDRIDRAMLKEMGGLGLIGVDLPEQYGGLARAAPPRGSSSSRSPMAISTRATYNCWRR